MLWSETPILSLFLEALKKKENHYTFFLNKFTTTKTEFLKLQTRWLTEVFVNLLSIIAKLLIVLL